MLVNRDLVRDAALIRFGTEAPKFNSKPIHLLITVSMALRMSMVEVQAAVMTPLIDKVYDSYLQIV